MFPISLKLILGFSLRFRRSRWLWVWKWEAGALFWIGHRHRVPIIRAEALALVSVFFLQEVSVLLELLPVDAEYVWQHFHQLGFWSVTLCSNTPVTHRTISLLHASNAANVTVTDPLTLSTGNKIIAPDYQPINYSHATYAVCNSAI